MKYALIFWVMTYRAGGVPIEVDRYMHLERCEEAAEILRQEKLHTEAYAFSGKTYAVCVPVTGAR